MSLFSHAPSVRAMSNTIVVGYDGSPEARAALSYAAARVDATGKLFIVSAAAPVPDLLGTPYYQEHLNASQSHSRELLDEAAEQIPAGVDYATELIDGPAA